MLNPAIGDVVVFSGGVVVSSPTIGDVVVFG